MFACTGLHGCELNGSILKSGATYDVTLAITVSAGAVDVNNDGTPEYTAADDLTIHVKIVNKQDAELHVTGISETMTYGDEMEWSYNAEHGAEDGTISCAAAPTGIVENIIENEKHVLKATGVGKATVTVTYDSPEYHAEQTFTITVQPKAVTVKADDKSRAYGEANPELTWSVQDGFSLVGQDTLNLTISTTAVSESVPGSYPITLTEVEGANPNYTVTTQDGTLTTNGLYAQNISLHTNTGNISASLLESNLSRCHIQAHTNGGPVTLNGTSLVQLNEDGSGTALYDNRYDTETQSYRLDFPLDLNATVGGSGRIDLLSKYEVGLVPQDTQGQDVT